MIWGSAAALLTLFPGVSALTLMVIMGWRHLRKANAFLWLGAVLWLIMPLWHNVAGFQQTAQALAFPILYSTGVALAARLGDQRAPVTTGVLASLSIMLFISVIQVSGFGLGVLEQVADQFTWLLPLYTHMQEAYASGRASGWLAHPNLWGVACLVPGCFVLVAPKMPRWRWWALPLMLATVLLAGSRASLLGLLFGLLALFLWLLIGGDLHKQHIVLGLLGLALAILVLVFTPIGVRFSATLGVFFQSDDPPSRNLLRASDVLSDQFWFERRVSVRQASADEKPQVWRIEKRSGGGGSRLQQQILLAPTTVYTLSLDMLNQSQHNIPGVLSWIKPKDTVHSLKLWRIEGAWHAEARGDLRILHYRVDDLGSGWQNITVTFKNTSDATLPFPIGITPDQQADTSGASVLVRKLQLELGDKASAYEPTLPPNRVALQAQSSAEGRWDIFTAACHGITERPWLGWGTSSFGGYFQEVLERSTVTVTHAHNLVLATLFSYGSLGFAILCLIMIGLLWGAGWPSFILVLVVLGANMFDYTFWSTHISYLLALACGLLSNLPNTTTLEVT